MIIVDEYNERMMELRDVPFEKGIKKLFEFQKDKDGGNILKKFIRYLDEDYKKLLGIKNDK